MPFCKKRLECFDFENCSNPEDMNFSCFRGKTEPPISEGQSVTAGYVADLACAYAFWLDPGNMRKSSAPRDRLENAIEMLLESENEKLISVFRKVNCRELSGTEAEGIINRILKAT